MQFYNLIKIKSLFQTNKLSNFICSFKLNYEFSELLFWSSSIFLMQIFVNQVVKHSFKKY